MNIELAGKTHQVSEGADGFGLFEDRSIIALRVNGELKDLVIPVNFIEKIVEKAVSTAVTKAVEKERENQSRLIQRRSASVRR